MRISRSVEHYFELDVQNGLLYPKLPAMEVNARLARKLIDGTIVLNNEANLEHTTLLLRIRMGSSGDPLFKKAAVMLKYLAYNAHAFANGNKRMSFILTNVYLNANGYNLHVPDKEEKGGYIRAVACGRIRSVAKIAKWIRSNSKPIRHRSLLLNFIDPTKKLAKWQRCYRRVALGVEREQLPK